MSSQLEGSPDAVPGDAIRNPALVKDTEGPVGFDFEEKASINRPLSIRSVPASPRAELPRSRAKSSATAVIDGGAARITPCSIPDSVPPPDGGLRAWTQCFCAWLAILNTWGFANSFGAFQTYYGSVLPQSASAISWIGSVQACLMFFLGAFSGRALDAGLFLPTVIIGIFLQLLGIFMMSLATTYWQLFLTQGVLAGIGGGIFFCPVLGVVSTYFAKRRGTALGLATSGNSTGGIIYPVIVRQLLPKLGFAWTVRILGFVNLGCLAVVVAFMKPRLPPRKTGPLIEWRAIRDIPYVLFVIGVCFLMAGMYFVFYYIASFARDIIGLSYTDSVNLVIVLNGIGIPARILPGYLADRCFGVLNTFITCLLVNILLLWGWLGVHNVAGCYAFTIIYGLGTAAFQSLFPTSIACLSDDITKTGTRLGMAFSIISVAALVGGPIGGALLQADGGGYLAGQAGAAASTMVGAGLIAGARVWKYGFNWRTKC